jgi:DNA-binding NarL/FixJ family response regulator
MSPPLPSGTVTFLFTDIEGSTRLLTRLGAAYGAVLADHRRRAARICSAAHGGQILLSQASYAVLVDGLPADVRLLDLGEHRLTDFDHPARLYQVVTADLPGSFPPPRTLGTAAPFDVPVARPQARHTRVPAAVTDGPIRLVVAEDSVLLREGLCRVLEDAGFPVVGRAGDASQLIRLVDELLPDVVISEIRMPPTNTDEGLVAAERIRGTHPEVGVLVLSQYLDARYALRLLQQYPERVGYLLKERVSDVAVLADAVRRIAEGECVIDPTIVSRLMRRQRAGGPLGELSDAELDLLTLVAEGHSNQTIGGRLGLDPGAVEAVVGGILARLGLSDGAKEFRRAAAVLSLLRASAQVGGGP